MAIEGELSSIINVHTHTRTNTNTYNMTLKITYREPFHNTCNFYFVTKNLNARDSEKSNAS